jgi:hypothetical protein
MTDDERKSLVPVLEKYWEINGYPYPNIDITDITDEYDKLLNFDINSILVPESKELTQNNTGLNSANCFHPHKYHVKCKEYRAPYENFINKERFRSILFKVMKFRGSPFNRTHVRNFMGIYSGTQSVSNFRPTVARYIYEKYCPRGGKVLDPSLGYSGRLLGALSSPISHYEGCDPCVASFNGGQNLLKMIEKIEAKRNKLSCFMDDCELKTRLPKTILHNIPFEEYEGTNDFYDVVFTSPPYADTERYSDEDTQSWKKFPKYDLWVEGFLRPLITTSYRVLKKGGYLILNIYGKIGKYCLEEDTIRIAKEVFGHDVNDTIYLQMSKMIGIKERGQIENRNNRADKKIEPIFIWQK